MMCAWVGVHIKRPRHSGKFAFSKLRLRGDENANFRNDKLRGYVCLILLFLELLFPCAAQAESLSTVSIIISGDEIQLSDGDIVRLSQTKAFSDQAKQFLQKTLIGQKVILQNPATDRYGRIDGTLYIDGQQNSIQDSLLQAGLAFVYPATGDDPQIDKMLQEEAQARRNKTGAWATHSDTAADDAEKLIGQYGFVIGTVIKAERIKNKLYLNFGADWRTDFTIAIAAHDLRAFKKQGIDLLSLAGKTVRARGWVKRDFGPMITITDPHQIERTD